ncbi:MAG: hypothetical protein IJX22_05300 [Opitutales bacterium]|nr:hypothetical protein [Opitutales bacterium]MBQ9759057.1 hypothetical protein [Opitutales bacterium]
MLSKKKTGSVPVVVFAVLAVLWGAEVLFFYETLDSATEERDRLIALEEEKAAEREELERRVQELQHYTDIMLKDADFIEKEAREITGGAVEGEIIIRPEEG